MEYEIYGMEMKDNVVKVSHLLGGFMRTHCEE